MSTIFDHRPRPYTVIDDIVFECDLSSLQKMTLITLFKFAGKQSTAWPGVETLARCTSSSARQVRRVLHDLCELDLLRIERRRGQSSIYHIPEYRLSKNRLCSVWDDSTPDMVSPHPGHDDRRGMTSCQHPPDTMSPKESHLTVSKNISLSDPGSEPENSIEKIPPPSPSREIKKPTQESKSKKREREKSSSDSFLIKAWCEQFSISHTPVNAKEVKAMDWMLFAARNQAISNIKSPVGYLKTVCRNGHPTDFPGYSAKKSKPTLPVHLAPPAAEKWKIINHTYKQFFFMDAKDQGIPETQQEEFAYQLFKKEYQREQNQLR